MEEKSLQHEVKSSADKLEVFILCPGLSKDEVTISFDKKEGILDIMGEPKEKNTSETFELGISGKITIPAKHRSNKIEASVENGVATVTFGLAEDVNLLTIK
jgi:HSP20 family molecular chaperone IbpA